MLSPHQLINHSGDGKPVIQAAQLAGMFCWDKTLVSQPLSIIILKFKLILDSFFKK